MGGLNMNGGVVVHRGGINLTPTLGDTIGVIEAKGAEGARVYPDSNGH
jgi:outer membrane usher protein